MGQFFYPLANVAVLRSENTSNSSSYFIIKTGAIWRHNRKKGTVKYELCYLSLSIFKRLRVDRRSNAAIYCYNYRFLIAVEWIGNRMVQ